MEITSVIRINWGERSSGLVKKKVTPKDRKLRTQLNGKCNDISSAHENK
jgi:hypothetical protein